MKRFIAYISQQPRGYNKLHYQPTDCPQNMEYGETRLPILPVMNATVDRGECIEVILVATKKRPDEVIVEGETVFDRNKRYTVEELQAWANTNDVKMQITSIEQEEQASVKDSLWLLEQLIGAVNTNWSEEDVFYTDITFGLKPMTLVMLYALRYINSVKKNKIGHIVYGMVVRDDNGKQSGELYEVTSLFYMDSMIAKLGEMDIPEPTKIIQMILQDAISDEEGE